MKKDKQDNLFETYCKGWNDAYAAGYAKPNWGFCKQKDRLVESLSFCWFRM